MRWRLLKTMYFQCMTEWISRSALLLFLKWRWNDCTLNSPDTSGFMKNVQRLRLVFTYKVWLWQKVNKHILSSYLKFNVHILGYFWVYKQSFCYFSKLFSVWKLSNGTFCTLIFFLIHCYIICLPYTPQIFCNRRWSSWSTRNRWGTLWWWCKTKEMVVDFQMKKTMWLCPPKSWVRRWKQVTNTGTRGFILMTDWTWGPTVILCIRRGWVDCTF